VRTTKTPSLLSSVFCSVHCPWSNSPGWPTFASVDLCVHPMRVRGTPSFALFGKGGWHTVRSHPDQRRGRGGFAYIVARCEAERWRPTSGRVGHLPSDAVSSGHRGGAILVEVIADNPRRSGYRQILRVARLTDQLMRIGKRLRQPHQQAEAYYHRCQ
jgi:hypothetical protein